MSYEYHTVDVFTDKPFGGNQLAVLPDARGLSTEDMHAITREFNYSETTFVLPPSDPRNTRRVRIFTPAREIPFAGPPTSVSVPLWSVSVSPPRWPDRVSLPPAPSLWTRAGTHH